MACDQPFDKVEKEEFIKLMTYARHPTTSVKLPSREGIKCRVKMGEDTIDGIHEMFAVHALVGSFPFVHSIWSRDLKGKSCYLLTHGPRATNMHF